MGVSREYNEKWLSPLERAEFGLALLPWVGHRATHHTSQGASSKKQKTITTEWGFKEDMSLRTNVRNGMRGRLSLRNECESDAKEATLPGKKQRFANDRSSSWRTSRPTRAAGSPGRPRTPGENRKEPLGGCPVHARRGEGRWVNSLLFITYTL